IAHQVAPWIPQIIGQRKELLHFFGNRMNAVGGNYVARERLAQSCGRIKRERVVYHPEQSGIEDALLLLERWCVGYSGLRAADADTLIGAEEERPVLADRSTDRAPELVLVIGRCAQGDIEKILGIQMIVAQEFIDAAVKTIRARAYGEIDVHAA